MANIVITHAKNNTIADWSGTVTVANSTGGTTTDQASNLVLPSDWNSNHVASMTLSASDISPLIFGGGNIDVVTSTNGITIAAEHHEYYEPYIAIATATTIGSAAVGSIQFDPVFLQGGLDYGHLNVFFVNPTAAFGGGTTFSTQTTGSASRYQTNYHRYALYTQGTDNASNSSISSYWSTEVQIVMSDALAVNVTTSSQMSFSKTAFISIPAQVDASGNLTYSTFSTSGTTSTTASTAASSFANNAVSQIANYITGSVVMPVPVNQSISGDAYFFAYQFSSSGSSTGTNYGQGSCLGAQSTVGLAEANFQAFRTIGATTTNSSTSPIPFDGYFSTTTSGFPATIGSNAMRYSTQNNRLYWNYYELP